MPNILDNVNSPKDLKELSVKELENLCSDIREFLIDNVSATGGHLASNLGVVELTVALHKVFDLPKDKLIWDVGHQSYVHKILTGRKNEFGTLRKYGGLSGFPKTNESEYDFFNTGHSSTSVSAALGMAHARDLAGDDYNIAAVFGDGAFTGGMMYEALNNGGQSKTKLILILNDNEMSISNNVGAISKYLCKLRTKKGYYHSKNTIGDILHKLPVGADFTYKALENVKNKIKHMVLPTNFFDDMGFDYLGPIDGHNIKDLINILEVAKIDPDPVFIHIKTTKGKGYTFAEKDPQKFHGIGKFNPKNGEVCEKPKTDYSAVFGKKLVSLAEKNEKIVAITGAMPDGTGLVEFMNKYPKRFFDVGIAEQHAVTMGAGLAVSGYVPVIPIYSSFMQRAYDQILHDVCLQKLHVVFCLDRAGVVGADGETHHGLYDIGFMSQMPYMSILSPSSFTELEQMLEYAINEHDGPIAIRYPKGNSEYETEDFAFKKAILLKSGKDISLISTGRMLNTAAAVAERLERDGISENIIALPTILPLDEEMILKNVNPLVAVIEDHCIGSGISSMIAQTIAENAKDCELMEFAFPNEPIVHGRIDEIDRHYKLDEKSIYERIKEKFGCRKK